MRPVHRLLVGVVGDVVVPLGEHGGGWRREVRRGPDELRRGPRGMRRLAPFERVNAPLQGFHLSSRVRQEGHDLRTLRYHHLQDTDCCISCGRRILRFRGLHGGDVLRVQECRQCGIIQVVVVVVVVLVLVVLVIVAGSASCAAGTFSFARVLVLWWCRCGGRRGRALWSSYVALRVRCQGGPLTSPLTASTAPR